MTSAERPSRRMRMESTTASQTIALVAGVLFVLVGLIGFAVTGTSDFAGSNTDKSLLGFELNPLHNLVHLALGAIGLALWRTDQTARTYGWLLFIGYGLAFLYGLFVVNNTSGANFLSLNSADNGLHLVSAIIGIAAAMAPASSTQTSSGRGRFGGHAPI